MNLDTVKSSLSDLASSTLDTVADTLHHGQDAISDTTKSVGKDVSRTAKKIMKSDPITNVSEKIATVGKVVAAATSAKAIAKALNPELPINFLLGSLGLQRRPSAFSRILTGVGLVAAGAAVGAGVALLLTPRTGPQNRAMLRRGFRSVQRDAEQAVDQIETQAQDAADQVTDKVQGLVHDVESQAKSLITDVRDGQGSSDGAARSTGGGAGTSGSTVAKPRTPGLSHRSPKI